MTFSDLEITLGDATSIDETTAWGAFQTLKQARTNPELAADPNLAKTREALKTYVTERRAGGHALFPNVMAAENKKRNDLLVGLYTKPLDKVIPPENAEEIKRRASLTADPAAFEQRFINHAFLSATVGRKLTPEEYPIYRQIYAKQNLGLKDDTSDQAFFTARQNLLKEEQSADAALTTFAKQAFLDTLEGKPRTQPDTTNIPERLRPSFQEAAYRSQREAHAQIRRVKRSLQPTLSEIDSLASKELERAEKNATSLDESWFYSVAQNLPTQPADQQIALALIAQKLQSLPQTEKNAVARIAESIERGTTEAALSGEAFLQEGIGKGLQTILEKTGGKTQITKEMEQRANIRSDARLLRRMLIGEIDPLQYAGDSIVTESLVKAGGSAWTLPASFAGPAGWSFMAASFAGDSYEQARQANPEAGAGSQYLAAAASGTGQAALETVLNKVGFKVIGSKLPTLAGFMNKAGISNPLARTAIAGTLKAGAITATEYSEEALQGATDRLAQDLALEFNNIAPNTDWKKFWGEWATVAGEEQRATLLAIAPFAVVGAGAGSIGHFKYGQALARSKPVLHALGFNEQQIYDIVRQTDVKKTDALIKEAFAKGLENRTAEERSAALEVLREQNRLNTLAGRPRITRADSAFTYTFTDPITQESTEFETEEEALIHWRNRNLEVTQAAIENIQDSANLGAVDFLTSEGKASEDTIVEEDNRTMSLPRAVKEGIATQEQLDARLQQFLLQEGLPLSQAVQAVESVIIKARSFTKQTRDGQLHYIIQLFKGADPINIFEDFAEDALKRAFQTGFADPRVILSDLRAYEAATGDSILDPAYKFDPDNTLPLIEGFSALARAQVIDGINAEALPPTVNQWLETITTFADNTLDKAKGISKGYGADIDRAANLRQAINQGKLPDRLTSLIQDSIGINEKEILARLEAKHREQLAAEAMEGFPEIQEAARGRIPHPETLRQNQHPLAGEVRRIWENMKRPTRARTKAGRTVDRTNEANAYFLPIGQMEDLDNVRRYLEQIGFAVDTPADMIDALDSSISYNKPIYGTNSTNNESFSLGGASAKLFSKAVEEGRTFEGKDGKPRFEMDASEARFRGLMELSKFGELWTRPISAVIEFDEFFENYPEARAINVSTVKGMGANTNGRFLLGKNIIQLNADSAIVTQASALLHEMQHWIQEREGFAQGGNPKNFSNIDRREVVLKSIADARTAAFESIPDEFKEDARKINRGDDANGEAQKRIQANPAAKLAWANYYNAQKDYEEIKDSDSDELTVFTAEQQYLNLPGEKEARGVQARASMTAEERARTPFMSQWDSYSLGPKSISRIEAAIARKLTAAPDERAEFYSRLRDRLASLTQRLEDMENGIGPFARKPTDEAGEERRRIQDAIAEAKAVISALPIEARGRVDFDFDDITGNSTEKGRVAALLRLIDKADAALEVVLKKEYLEAFARTLDLASPELRQNRSMRGRLTPETQRLINAIIPITHLTQLEAQAATIQAQAAYDAIEAQYPDPTDETAVETWEAALANAQENLDLLNTFASLSSQTSAEIAEARKQLLEIYTKGRTARQLLDQAKRSEIASQKSEVIESLGGPVSQAKWAKRTEKAGFADLAESYRIGLSSFHEVMEWLFPNSIAARDYQEAIRASERAFTRAKIDARQRFESFGYTAFNLTGKSRKRKLNRIIAALSTRRSDWDIEIAEGTRFETEKMTEEQAAAILDGTLKIGWEKDLIAMESLRQALADFRLQRESAKAQSKAFSKKVVKFQRLTQRGAPTFLRMSDLEAVYWLQLAAQDQYLPALDRYGFTKEVLEQIKAKVDPRAQTFAGYLRKEYDAQWGRLNPVHQRLFGMDMPRIKNYAPGMFESLDSKGDATIGMDGAAGSVNAMSAGFTKARVHHMARPRQMNALAAYWSSLESTEYFIAWAETMRDMRQVFRSPDVRRVVEGNYGTRAARDFSTWLDTLETDGRARALEAIGLSELSQNTLTTQSAVGLAFNLGTIFKQWSAGLGHFMHIPTTKAIKATFKALVDPSTLKSVWNNEAIQQRILSGITPEDKRLMDAANASPSLAMEWLDIGRLPIAFADAAFTTLTGAASYKYQYDEAIKAGIPDAEAHRIALQYLDYVVTRTAQPATTQDKSLAENSAKGFAKFLFLFKSDPRQKFAKSASALRLMLRGDISKAEGARRIFFSWMIYGLMAQVASDIWRSISRDDDEEENWNPEDYIAAMVAGPLSGLPLLGAAFEGVIRSLAGSKVYTNSANPLDKAVAAIFKEGGISSATWKAATAEEIDVNEILAAATRDAGNLALLLGPINSAFAIVPAGLRLTRDVVGIGGNIADAFLPESSEEKAERIIREEKANYKDTSTTKRENTDDLLKELMKLDPATREKRIAKLDKETRRKIIPRVRRAQMTPAERGLAGMPLAPRKAAIDRILKELPEEDRQPYLDRLEKLGIASP